MHIDALSDIVIIRRSPPPEYSDGGIALAYDEDHREDVGEVVFVGRGKLHTCSRCHGRERVPVDVHVGDKVLFSTNGHQIVNLNNEQLVVTREKSIMGVIEND